MANDHYVPQFYLRNFSSKKEKVFEYTRNEEKPEEKWIKEVASEQSYYDYQIKAGGKDSLEGVLAMIESQAAPIIKRIVSERKFDLSSTSKEYGQLIYFIAMLSVRVPAHKKKSEALGTSFAEVWMDSLINNKKGYLEAAKKASPKASENDLLKARDAYLAGKIKLTAVFPDKSPLDKDTLVLLNHDIYPLLLEKNWAVVTTNSTRNFITSDNPVNVTQFEGRRFSGFKFGVIFVPLSPNVALMGFDAKLTQIVFNREQVGKANYDQMYYSHEHVFSSFESKDIQNDYNGTNFGEGQSVEVEKVSR